jgi:hypothetical protein
MLSSAAEIGISAAVASTGLAAGSSISAKSAYLSQSLAKGYCF